MKINYGKYKLNYQHLNVKNEETLCSAETETISFYLSERLFFYFWRTVKKIFVLGAKMHLPPI